MKPTIRKEVLLHHPDNLDQAIELSKLIEDKLCDEQPRAINGNGSSKPMTHPPLLSNLGRPLGTRPSISIKWLTLKEMMVKREKGLCYNCDEQLYHIYKVKLFSLLIDTKETNLIE